MRKAWTILALSALLLAGAGLSGCASKKACCDGNPACAECAKGQCADCAKAGGTCAACAAKPK